MYCPACGVKNEDDAVKCFICGKLMPGVFEPKKDDKQKHHRPRIGTLTDQTAALGDRMIAMCLDTLLLTLVIAGVALIAADRWDLVPQSIVSLSPNAAIVLGSITLVVAFLYFWLLEGLAGATLGKAIVGIRVERADGLDISLRESLVRNVLRLIDGLVLYFIGFVVSIFSRRRQRIGDHLASTIVVNDPPGKAARAGVLVLWLALVAAPPFAVWKLVEPARTLVETSVLQRTVPDASSPASRSAEPTELTLVHFAWLASEEGPAVETATFKPGERSYARYELTGFGKDERGAVNVLTESTAFDSAGTPIAKPVVSTILEPAPDTPLQRVDALQIPRYSAGGEYQFRVRVRDLARGRDATFVEEFVVDAEPTEPAASLEVRNFIFSIAENGFPLDSPVFDIGETVHFRYEIHGLQFVDDRIDAETSYRFIDPDGRTLYFKPKWEVVEESHRYHPPSFNVMQTGSVSLPSDANSGIYILQHEITDNLAGASITHSGQFALR